MGKQPVAEQETAPAGLSTRRSGSPPRKVRIQPRIQSSVLATFPCSHRPWFPASTCRVCGHICAGVPSPSPRASVLDRYISFGHATSRRPDVLTSFPAPSPQTDKSSTQSWQPRSDVLCARCSRTRRRSAGGPRYRSLRTRRAFRRSQCASRSPSGASKSHSRWLGRRRVRVLTRRSDLPGRALRLGDSGQPSGRLCVAEMGLHGEVVVRLFAFGVYVHGCTIRRGLVAGGAGWNVFASTPRIHTSRAPRMNGPHSVFGNGSVERG